ncbi:MAG: hypothetical protein M3Y19_08300 [Actinomycetota bacterium]|nr:hypothetical protein [Actinomycetota bacterium]
MACLETTAVRPGSPELNGGPGDAGAIDTEQDAEAVFLAVERLFAEFHRDLSKATVEGIVRGARVDLDTVAEPSLPELVERLGRQRLIGLVAGARSLGPGSSPSAARPR